MPSMNRMGERATPRRKSMPKTKMPKRTPSTEASVRARSIGEPMAKDPLRLKRLKRAEGGKALRPVDKKKNPGLAKLPTSVRNKMGFMKDGGIAKRNKASKAIFRNIKTKDAFKKASGKK